jgi:hypothetical protein
MRPWAGGPPVPPIDEIDRTGAPLRAFLREALSEVQVTILEPAPIRAPAPPVVMLLHPRADHPGVERVAALVRARVPGTAEMLDWAECRLARDVIALSPEAIAGTPGAVPNPQDDNRRIEGSAAGRILNEVQAALAAGRARGARDTGRSGHGAVRTRGAQDAGRAGHGHVTVSVTCPRLR